MNEELKRLEEIKHRFAGDDIRFSMSRMDFDWLLSQLAEKDREIERLEGFEKTAQWLLNVWDEFEKPLPLECNIQESLQLIYEWASEWYSHAEQAEADRDRCEARAEKLLAAGKEMLKMIESVDYEPAGYDAGPNNDDLNRWHAALEDER